ncbi:MAG: hypothetical protein HC851_22530 [Acaryochloris sp. RU_4_1]|nr:hypothetical protein [Acaryochloris sp. RU_4_1]NJR56970.1 hypothetical protein [Acaryochloris sp. CRU_2_0]
MKPITKNQLIPQIVFTTAIELDHQQIAQLNRLVLTNRDLADDEALDLWRSLNPFVQQFQHSNPRDVFSSLRVVALAKSATGEPEPPYPVEMLNDVRSDIEADGWGYICC